MRFTRVAAVLLTLTIVGCDSGGKAPEKRTGTPEKRTGIHSYEGRVIRGWLLALERQDYTQAAYYFAPDALIDQCDPYRLRTPVDAAAFNASLPCRADLVRLEKERPPPSRGVLATFALRAGPGGPCSGEVRVRYTIRDGKFTEWRQLPNPDRPRDLPRSSAARPGAYPS